MDLSQFYKWSKDFSIGKFEKDTGFQAVYNLLGRMIIANPSILIASVHIQAFMIWVFMAGLERGRKESAMQNLLAGKEKGNE